MADHKTRYLRYNDNLDPGEQVDVEELIAATIADRMEVEGCDEGIGTLDENDCADLGRTILKLVLERFRPDLMTGDL